MLAYRGLRDCPNILPATSGLSIWQALRLSGVLRVGIESISHSCLFSTIADVILLSRRNTLEQETWRMISSPHFGEV